MFSRVRDSGSIVLVGSFNPAIFHPFWFLTNKLILQTEYDATLRASEAAANNGEEKTSLGLVISDEVAQFELDWLSLQVFRDRFIARAKTAEGLPLLRDLVCSVCSILEHTPVNQLGINRELQFQVPVDKDWVRLGDVLAPKDHWKKYLHGQPGLTALQIFSSLTDDLNKDVVGSVNTSVKVVDIQKRIVEVATNNHFVLKIVGSKASDAANIVMSRWEKSLDDAERTAVGIVTDCLKEK